MLALGNAEIQSHPAQYDTDSFWLLSLPHRDFLLLTTEQKPLEVIHDNCLRHGGNDLAIIFANPQDKARNYLLLLEFCL